MKKLFSLALALIMIFALATTAMADGEGTPAPSEFIITVNNGVVGQDYAAYKIFDVTYTTSAWSYTIHEDSPWYATVDAYENVSENGMTLTKAYAVDKTWVVTVNNKFSAADFAATLIAALGNKTAAGEIKGYSDSNKTIDVGEAGYYLVDSNLGSLCALNTADPNAEIYEKNSLSTIEKKVMEEGENWADQADFDYNQKVFYQLTVTIEANAYNEDDDANNPGIDDDYVIYDTLPTGVTYNAGSIAINGWTLDTDYTFAQDDEDAQKLIITLKESKLVDCKELDEIVITYDATMTTDAAVDTKLTNVAELWYKNVKRDEADADVYTYDFDLFKHNEAGEALADAWFQLSNGTKFAKATKDNNGDYTFTGWVEKADATTFETPADGTFNVKGLDQGSYILTETKAPAGYNLLSDDVDVTVAADINAEYTVDVLNQAGALLPSTGGIGTTIFYTVGGILVLAAGVLLITKKRMSGVEE